MKDERASRRKSGARLANDEQIMEPARGSRGAGVWRAPVITRFSLERTLNHHGSQSDSTTKSSLP